MDYQTNRDELIQRGHAKRKQKLEIQLECLQPKTCVTEADVTPCIVTTTEASPPHPSLQKLHTTRASAIYKTIVDGSIKKVHEEYFVENQTSKASENS